MEIQITLVFSLIACAISIYNTFKNNRKDGDSEGREMASIVVELRYINSNISNMRDDINKLNEKLDKIDDKFNELEKRVSFLEQQIK